MAEVALSLMPLWRWSLVFGTFGGIGFVKSGTAHDWFGIAPTWQNGFLASMVYWPLIAFAEYRPFGDAVWSLLGL